MKKHHIEYYNIPDKYWYRIHFVRPRFKSNIENVLLFMANECCRIPRCTCDEYRKRFFEAIKTYPGNIDLTDKTLNNWRTEIPALFSFYTEDKDSGITETSNMAFFLHERQDLTQFLKLFLYSFQIPGGHLKPQDLKDVIAKGIRFKPASLIINILLEGNKLLANENTSKDMSISAEEATYCIFNDIRVVSGSVEHFAVAQTILTNRKNKIKYYNKQDHNIMSLKGNPRTKGDITRYAGDILDYMTVANLLEKRNGYYRLKGNEIKAIQTFATDNTFFKGYDTFYGRQKINTSELATIEASWFDYVNRAMRPDLFNTDITTFFQNKEIPSSTLEQRVNEIIERENKNAKDVGNLGEAIICGHEKMRLLINGYEKFIRLVQVIDTTSYHPGFDIDSFEADGTENHRYIEVKTTISKQQIRLYGFHMTPNEWRVAGTIKEHYCVYRLMLSEQGCTLYILRDPVRLYKTDKIEAEPSNGMDIVFNEKTFSPTELLIWKR